MKEIDWLNENNDDSGYYISEEIDDMCWMYLK